MNDRPGLVRSLAKIAETAFDGASALILAAMVLIVLWGVFTRFWIGEPSWWTEEAATQLLVWASLLGAASASARAEHLGVDYLMQRLHPDARRSTAIAVELIVIVFSAVVLVYGGVVLVTETLAANQTTPALEIKKGYIYLAAPIGGLGMILFSLDRFLRHLAEPSTTGDGRPG